LHGYADFIAYTVLRITFLLLKPVFPLLLGALAETTSGDEDMLGTILETSSTSN